MPEAPAALRACFEHVARRTVDLLREAEPLIAQVRNLRLALEIAAVHRLAQTLVGVLLRRDPFSERVHLRKAGFAASSLLGVGQALLGRAGRRMFRAGRAAQDA
jgi:hypothetical protein